MATPTYVGTTAEPFADKSPAPGLTLPPSWTVDNVGRAVDLNAIKAFLDELRTHTTGVVNVKSYGAKGDGSTDDTAAIQAALDAGYGKVVFLPQGNYRIASGPLVVHPLSGGTSQLPISIRGAGFDGNGGNGGTFLTCVGSTDCIQIVNSGGSSINNLIALEDFGLYGDGADATGGNGITAQQTAGLILRRLWVGGFRQHGISLTRCWGAIVEECTVTGNRMDGIYINQQFNQGRLLSNKVLSNGKVYSQATANIWFEGGVGYESLAPLLDNNDVSYAGGSPFQSFSTAGGTITSIVVSGGTATVTTSTAHNLTSGWKVTINGSSSGFDSIYPYTVTATDGTHFTFPTSVGAGTYNNSTDPYLKIGPHAFGMFLKDIHGAKVSAFYAEDTSDSIAYLASNVSSLSISGGYIQGQWFLVDNATSSEIRGVEFAPGQRNASTAAGVYNNVSQGFDVSRSVTFDTNTQFIQATVQKRDGRYFSSAAPGPGTWAAGDHVWNTAPSELGSAGSKYVVQGWACTAGGTPGTWLPMRALTGN